MATLRLCVRVPVCVSSQVTRLELAKAEARLASRHIALQLSDKAVEWLADAGTTRAARAGALLSRALPSRALSALRVEHPRSF